MIDTAALIKEFTYNFIRSGGKGGQHVNKVSSKVELHFNIANSEVLTDEQKAKLEHKLSKLINKSGELIVVCDMSRSQHTNKDLANEKMCYLIESSLIVQKKRKPTKPTKASKEKRLQGKTQQALKKNNRNISKSLDHE